MQVVSIQHVNDAGNTDGCLGEFGARLLSGRRRGGYGSARMMGSKQGSTAPSSVALPKLAAENLL